MENAIYATLPLEKSVGKSQTEVRHLIRTTVATSNEPPGSNVRMTAFNKSKPPLGSECKEEAEQKTLRTPYVPPGSKGIVTKWDMR